MTLHTTTPWAHHAACKGHNPNWWYPEPGDTTLTSPTKDAITICTTCPVRDDCLNHAVQHEAWGIWGGMTAHQRDRYRRTLGYRSMHQRGSRGNP